MLDRLIVGMVSAISEASVFALITVILGCLNFRTKDRSGPGCSKLTTSLVNVSLKFQTLISEICQYFLLKKCEKLLHCKSFSHFFIKKYQCIWL